jgi:hypothetical protein
MVLRMIVGLVLTAVAIAIFGRRLWWLKRLAFSGQPAPERLEYARSHPGREAETQLTEVIGQRKLLRWTIPGAAHAATFWGFIVLALTGVVTFTVIRLRDDPHKKGRASRFDGSHTRAAWLVLAMITAVIVTLLIYRGAQLNTGVFPYPHGWAFASWVVALALHPPSATASTASLKPPSSCSSSASCWPSWSSWPTPSTCTSASPRSTSCSPAAPTPSGPLALDPDTITTACPYCTVMLGDAVNAKKASGEAKETLEVIDVAQLLVRSVRLREG